MLSRHLAVCLDYDGTLAHHGVLDDETARALERLKASGRRLLMVTGRQLDDLRRVCRRVDLFDRIVAENGALLFAPETGDETLLSDPPPAAFVDALRRSGIEPLSVGRGIVATWEPHDAAVLQTIRELGLELQVIFNKGAVMVLPPGVNKASGAEKALRSLGLSPHNAIAVGDAQNDHAMLAKCQVAVAVANALPSVKADADIVTRGDHGAGVRELIDELLTDDLASRAPNLRRHRVELGRTADGETLTVDPNHSAVLITGRSGSGKSTVSKGLLVRLAEQAYSFCVIDPEGDYLELPHAVTVGTAEHPLTPDEAAQALASGNNVVLNLLGIALDERPGFLAALIPRIEERRVRTGQPHCVLIDEAHHMLGSEQPATIHSLARLDRSVMVTVHPDLLAREVLQRVDTLLIVGAQADASLRQFAAHTGRALPVPEGATGLQAGEALVWQAALENGPRIARMTPSRAEHRRHSRKYAEGQLDEQRSFYFRGPEGRLNLRAQNLTMFVQMANGVDDETWDHHLKRHDYSEWIARQIKDEALAKQVREIEGSDAPAPVSKARVRQAIDAIYTLPG